MNKKTLIWVTFRKEGIHKYPAALDDPKLATGDEYDVSFLGYPHRHIFHFKVGIEVFHNDRDIEFIHRGNDVKINIILFSIRFLSKFFFRLTVVWMFFTYKFV